MSNYVIDPWGEMLQDTDGNELVMHPVLRAKCMSRRCKGKKKDVPKETIDCPNCKSALIWERVGKKKRGNRSPAMPVIIEQLYPLGDEDGYEDGYDDKHSEP